MRLLGAAILGACLWGASLKALRGEVDWLQVTLTLLLGAVLVATEPRR